MVVDGLLLLAAVIVVGEVGVNKGVIAFCFCCWIGFVDDCCISHDAYVVFMIT